MRGWKCEKGGWWRVVSCEYRGSRIAYFSVPVRESSHRTASRWSLSHLWRFWTRSMPLHEDRGRSSADQSSPRLLSSTPLRPSRPIADVSSSSSRACSLNSLIQHPWRRVAMMLWAWAHLLLCAVILWKKGVITTGWLLDRLSIRIKICLMNVFADAVNQKWFIQCSDALLLICMFVCPVSEFE